MNPSTEISSQVFEMNSLHEHLETIINGAISKRVRREITLKSVVDLLFNFRSCQNAISQLGQLKFIAHCYILARGFICTDSWAGNDGWPSEDVSVDLKAIASSDNTLFINYRLFTRLTDYKFNLEFSVYPKHIKVSFNRRDADDRNPRDKSFNVVALPALQGNMNADYDIVNLLFHEFDTAFYPLWKKIIEQSLKKARTMKDYDWEIKEEGSEN